MGFFHDDTLVPTDHVHTVDYFIRVGLKNFLRPFTHHFRVSSFARYFIISYPAKLKFVNRRLLVSVTGRDKYIQVTPALDDFGRKS
jgi:hypothetical protein